MPQDLRLLSLALQQSVPEAFAPGITKLCRPDTPGHQHRGKVCSTPGKRPLFARFNAAALERYAAAREARFDALAWVDEAATWLDEGYNVGLVPPLGVVVLDLDNRATVAWTRAMLGDLVSTAPRQERGSEKAHIWLRYDESELPLRSSALRFLLPDGSAGSMDLRVGGRSQVAVVPSRHASQGEASGAGYAWVVPLPESIGDLPEMPRELARALAIQLGLSAQGAARAVSEDGVPHIAPSPAGVAAAPAGHDLLRGYVNRLCRYSSGAPAAPGAIRERAARYAGELMANRRERLAEVLAEGGELDRLIASGWERFGAAAPLAEDKTDQGCLDLLVATSGEDWRYLVQSGEWIAWGPDRGHWARGWGEMLGRSIGRMADVLFDDALREADIERRGRLLALAKALRSNARVESVMRRAQKVYAVDECDCDALPWAVTFPGGWLDEAWHPAVVFDLETGETREPRREDLLTRAMGAPWAPGARSAEWERFLTAGVPDSTLRDYLARAVGMALAGATLEHAFFFLHGPGGTGKSTLLNTLADAFGDLAVRCDVRTFAEDTRRSAASASPDVVRLKGARLAICSEIPDRARLGARMKDLTGGDRILARGLFGKPLEFAPSHTVMVAGNCEPQADWMDTGVWRRLRQIPLDVVHREADAQLPLRLATPSARAAVAQWAIGGWRAYQANGGLGSCARVDRATQEYRARLDPLAEWLEERVQRGASQETLAELWSNYNAFTHERYGRARAVLTQRQFVLLLGERGLTTARGTGGAVVVRGLALIRAPGQLRAVPSL